MQGRNHGENEVATSAMVGRIHTVKSRVEARVTIQKIKSLGVLQTEACH